MAKPQNTAAAGRILRNRPRTPEEVLPGEPSAAARRGAQAGVMADIPGSLVDLSRGALGYGAAGLESLLPPEVAEGLGVSGFRRYMMPYSEEERRQARAQYGAAPFGSSERIEEELVKSGALPPTTGTREEMLARMLAGLADAAPGPVGAGTVGRKLADSAQANVVSTRFPTAVKATEDPIAERLIVDLQSAKSDPVAFEHNVNLTGEYPNVQLTGKTADERAEQFIEHVKDNLVYLHDQVPEATRQRSKLWYDGARKLTTDFSQKYDLPDQAVAGVFAVLSPQKDWFMNVSLGERVMDTMVTKQNFAWTDDMNSTAQRIYGKERYQAMMDNIRGKTLSELEHPVEKAAWIRIYDETYNPREHRIVSPEGSFEGVRMKGKKKKSPMKTGWGSNNEIAKAVDIIENQDIANISRRLGGQHKVRNFYNNIYAPNDPGGHVTIDTHAVAAGLMRPLAGKDLEVAHNFGSNVKGFVGPKSSSLTGMKGTYGLYAEAYRRAADERNILPREMQSITWEAVRGLYTPQYKGQKENVDAINRIWQKHKSGQIDINQAREQAMQHAGGINPPEWE